MNWFPINVQVKTTELLRVSRSELKLQDLFVHLDDVTELQDDSVFRLQPGQSKTLNFFTDLIVGVRIVHEPNLVVVERTILTFLDVLAEIGGL